MNTNPMCYVGRRPCGHWVGICMDDATDKKSTAKFLSQMVKAGASVDRVPLEDVQQGKIGESCKCHRKGGAK